MLPLASLYELARYPFASAADAYLRESGLSAEEVMTPKVLQRAKERVMLALINKPIDVNLSDLDAEVLSFFVAMIMVKSCHSAYLERVFSRAEGKRAREAFKSEDDAVVCKIINELFDMQLEIVDKLPWQATEQERMKIKYQAPLAKYLKVASDLQQIDNPKFSLIDNLLYRGKIFLTREKVMELVHDQFSVLILQKLRKMPYPSNIPAAIKPVLEEIQAKIPRPRTLPSSKYEYIEKILQANIQDGRHRILWLILPPYLVNVKRMSDEEAFDVIKRYVDKVGWKEGRADRLILYNIRRARRIGLLPPTLERLSQSSPSLYRIIMDGISSVSS